MTRSNAYVSRAMLIAGALMILAGLGWGLSMRLNAPPPPTFTDAGAVVVAVTGPTARPTEPRSTSSPTALPTVTPTPTTDPILTERASSRLRTVPRLAATNPPPTPTATPTLPPTPTATATPTQPVASTPPTRIVAPAIKLDASVVPMNWEMVNRNGTLSSRWVVPANAAGWHVNSALPGHDENVVVSGHHNIDGKVFRYVVDLEPGNSVTLYVGDQAFEYTVTEKYILKEAGMPRDVRLKNAQWIMPAGDERLTLVTCWPYEWPGNTHRVIVVARPASFFESLGDTTGEQ